MKETPPIPSPYAPEFIKSGPSEVFCFQLGMPRIEGKRLHYHDNHEIYYCAEAGGYQHTPHHTFTMKKGEVYFFPAGIPHHGNGHTHGKSIGIVLTFSESVFEGHGDDSPQLFERLVNLHSSEDPMLSITASTSRRLRRLMEDCTEECKAHAPGFRALLRARMLEVMALFARDSNLGPLLKDAVTPLDQQERLAPVLRHCALHYREPITIEELAKLTHLGRSQFHNLFQKEVGHSPGQHLAQLRIAEAQRLLNETDLSVLEVSMEVGYQTLSHFYKQFKRITGKAPLDSRF